MESKKSAAIATLILKFGVLIWLWGNLRTLSRIFLHLFGLRFGDNLGTLNESESKADHDIAAAEDHQVGEDDVLQNLIGSDEEESAQISDDHNHNLECCKKFVLAWLELREEARRNHHQTGHEQHENREE